MGNLSLMEGMSLLLVEGKDAEKFFIQACDKSAFGADKFVQVLDFGGITELTRYIKGLRKMKGFDKVPAVWILRDAEDNFDNAAKSVQNSLRENNLTVPKEPYCFEGEFPKVCFGLLPGTMNDGKYDKGALEDLCLKTLPASEEKYLRETDSYLKKIGEFSKLTHKHKSRLHAYLAAKNKFVGMKIGEAAKAGAWDWNNDAFFQIKSLILNLEKYAEKNLSSPNIERNK